LLAVILLIFQGVYMAEENKFDSGHAVIPVHVGNGQVDHIAFPIDTPIPELHSALLDHVQSK
jgi:hypothetical protein